MGDLSAPIFCGPHRVCTDGNLLIVQFIGAISISDFRQLREQAELLTRKYGGIYMIADLEKSTGMPQEVRRAAVDWMREGKIYGVANVRANRANIALSTLLSNALRLLSRLHAQLTFVATEEEARAWIAETERKRQQAMTA